MDSFKGAGSEHDWSSLAGDWSAYATEAASEPWFGAEQLADNGSGQRTVDVTDWVRRATLLGDSNVNADLDFGGVLGDIESFYTAVLDWPAYVATYSGEVVLDDLINPTDPTSYRGLIYRNDANGDGVVTGWDSSHFFARHDVGRGDVDLNGVVDIRDWEQWKANFSTFADQFSDGDMNFDGEVSTADFTIWRDSLYEEFQSPNDPEIVLRVTADDPLAPASFVSSAGAAAGGQPGDAPQLNVNFHPHSQIMGFTTDGSSLEVSYKFPFGAPQTPEVSLYQVVDGVATEILAPTAITGTAGTDLTHTIDPSDFTIANPETPYELVVQISSGDGIVRTRSLDGGVFQDSTGDWHVYGTSADDSVEITPATILLAGPVSQTIDRTGSPAASVYANLGAGDDTYTLPATGVGVDSITISTSSGVDRLSIGQWDTPTLNLGWFAPQWLDD